MAVSRSLDSLPLGNTKPAMPPGFRLRLALCNVLHRMCTEKELVDRSVMCEILVYSVRYAWWLIELRVAHSPMQNHTHTHIYNYYLHRYPHALLQFIPRCADRTWSQVCRQHQRHKYKPAAHENKTTRIRLQFWRIHSERLFANARRQKKSDASSHFWWNNLPPE